MGSDTENCRLGSAEKIVCREKENTRSMCLSFVSVLKTLPFIGGRSFSMHVSLVF